MKFTCHSGDFQKALAIVEKSVSNRSSLPILENVFLKVSQNTLTLTGNDLEIGIKHELPLASVEAEGMVLVNAKTLINIVSKLPHEPIHFESNDQFKVAIKTQSVSFDINGVDPKEYPAFPDIEAGQALSLPAGNLKDLIRKTIFSVSFDETKQFLNGILMSLSNQELAFVATDGYRLAIRTQKLDGVDGTVSAIVPFKAMNELLKIVQGSSEEEPIKINISKNQVAFSKPGFLLVSRVIQGQFPDYRQVLPSELANQISIPRRAFIEASERANIIAQGANNVVRLIFKETDLTLKAIAAGLGEFKENLTLSRIKGQDEKTIAFNVRLLLDVMKILDEDDVVVSFNTELSPSTIKPAGDDDFTYIVMPIRTSDTTV